MVKLVAVLNEQIRADSGKALRIQRQDILQPQNRVSEQTTDQAEQQHGEGVLLPIVLLVRVDAHNAIGPALERAQNRIEPGLALRIEHLQQIKPHRLRDHRKRDDIECELNPAGSLHNRFLRISPGGSWR